MPKTLALFLSIFLVVGFALAGLFSQRPEKNGDRTIVTYMTWGDPGQRALEEKMAQKFMALNPDIEVRLAHVPSTAYLMKLNVMLASGTAPDVLRVDHYNFPLMVKKNYFQNLEPIIQQWKPGFDLKTYLAQFHKLAVDEGYHNGQLYGMNMLFGARLMYYNTAIFERHGLPTPYELWKKGQWDIEHFRQTCEKLSNHDPDLKQRTYGFRLTSESFWPFLWSLGGDALDLKTGELKLNHPDTVAALEWQVQLARDGLALPPDRMADRNPTFAFESGRIAMVMGWAGQAVAFKNSSFTNWDIAPLPEGKGGRWTTAKGNQLVVSANCKHPVAAWRWIEYLVSEECEREMCVKARRAVPTRLKLLENEYCVADPDPNIPPRHPDAFLASLAQYGRALPITERWTEWTTEMDSQLDSMWLMTKSPKQAAEDAQRAAKEILERDDY